MVIMKSNLKWRLQFQSCKISQQSFSPRQFVNSSVSAKQNRVENKPLFELLPLFTHHAQQSTSSAARRTKPAIPPKPVSRKIGVRIETLRSALPEEQLENEEKETIINIVEPKKQSNSDRFQRPCEMGKLRNASFRLIQEILSEKNSEKLRVLNIMKDDLKERLSKKVKILKQERDELNNDDVENEMEGLRIVEIIKEVGTLSEVDKLEIHMRESGSITNLLLFLRSKLYTTESLLQNEPDKDALNRKKAKLTAQLSEAVELKEFRERKAFRIERMLETYLEIGDFLSYTNYMETKLNLIKEKREVEDKIQLGEQMIYSLKMIDLNRKYVF